MIKLGEGWCYIRNLLLCQKKMYPSFHGAVPGISGLPFARIEKHCLYGGHHWLTTWRFRIQWLNWNVQHVTKMDASQRFRVLHDWKSIADMQCKRSIEFPFGTNAGSQLPHTSLIVITGCRPPANGGVMGWDWANPVHSWTTNINRAPTMFIHIQVLSLYKWLITTQLINVWSSLKL